MTAQRAAQKYMCEEIYSIK